MTTTIRRAVGLVVVLLSVLPIHRVLSPEGTGPWGAQAVDRAELAWSLTLWGTVVVALIGGVGVLLGQRRQAPGPVDDPGGNLVEDPVEGERAAGSSPGLVGRLRRSLEAPQRRVFVVAIGLMAGLGAAAVSLFVFERLLTNVDEMTALIHARYLAAGALGGPVGAEAAGWLVPNMLVVSSGWVSQYPPGHLVLLATFHAVGAWWLLAPTSFALTVALSTAALERLLPQERAVVRAAAILCCLSPFMLLLAGGALSHVTAGAAGALAFYAATRALGGRAGWVVLAGFAVGWMVLIRPWTGLLLGPVLTLGVWVARGGVAIAARRLPLWVAGGVPCAIGLFTYNRVLFGSATTLGYEVLYGPAHRLGFHTDPWSFAYGPVEALGYTASDLLQFGATLLETPVSLALVVGLFLVLAPRLAPSVRVLAAWAVVPVFGNALYWFHQPRMLFETGPAWIFLSAFAVAALWGSLPTAR